MATGSYNLAFGIIEQKGDLIRAEKLAREAVRIRTKVLTEHECTLFFPFFELFNLVLL
jgi:hypothetical protein